MYCLDEHYPPQVEFILWLALLGKLHTKELMARKGILLANAISCSFCSSHIEDLDHLLLFPHPSHGTYGKT